MKRLLTICVLLMAVIMTACVDKGTGEKVGTIIKLNHEGPLGLCMTWEAELIRGGFSDGSGAMGMAPFHFTIEDERLLPAVRKAIDEQAEVKVTYRQESFTMCRSEGKSDNYFLTGIEFVGKAAKAAKAEAQSAEQAAQERKKQEMQKQLSELQQRLQEMQ